MTLCLVYADVTSPRLVPYPGPSPRRLGTRLCACVGSVSPAHFHVCTAAACNAMAGNGRTDLSELFSAHRGITSDKITERKVISLLAREEGVQAIVGDGGAH